MHSCFGLLIHDKVSQLQPTCKCTLIQPLPPSQNHPKKFLPGNYIIPPWEKENQLQKLRVLTANMLVPRTLMQQTPATSLLLLLCLNQNLTCLRFFWGQAILGFSTCAFTGDKIYKWLTVIQRDCPTLLRVLHFCNAKECMKRMDILIY